MILAGAELFTDGVEWFGEGFGLSEGAVGSVLAAVGTALPETILPIIAIASGHASGEEIGVGAILGAPFILTTLAMVVIAVAILDLRARRAPVARRSGRHQSRVIRQDLGYFLVMYALAVVAGLLHVKFIDSAWRSCWSSGTATTFAVTSRRRTTTTSRARRRRRSSPRWMDGSAG